MQGASDGQGPAAAPVEQARDDDAAEAGATPFHPGTRAFFRQWAQDHPWLSLPLRRLRERTRLLDAWPDRPRRPLLRWFDASLPIFLGMFLLALLFNQVELFGLDNATKARSQQVSARMMAPFYRSAAQDHVAVVLINDQTLHERGIGWPPRYAFYDELLRRILAHRPRAVYVDVLLEQLRDYDDSHGYAREALAATLESASRADVDGAASEVLRGGRVPVFFGVSAPGRGSVFAGTGVQHVVTSWQGVGSAYPLLIDAGSVFAAGGEHGSAATGAGGADHRSVALALYQAVCPDAQAPGCAQAAAALPAQAQALPMAVQWGSSLPVLEEPWPLLDCTGRAPPSRAGRWRESFGLMFDSLSSGMREGIEDRNRQRCAYTLTVLEQQVEDDALLGDAGTGKALLEDRVVLVGTHLLGLNDRVLSPVHQQVPGVYLHAMALDNLMAWGDRRIHVTPGLGKYVLAPLTGLLMSLACGAVLVGVRRPPWARTVLIVAAPLLVGLAMVVLAQEVLRQPPQDWIGMACVAVLVGIYVKGRAGKAERGGGHDDGKAAAEQGDAPAGGVAVDGAGSAGMGGGGTAAARRTGGGADGGAGAPPAGGL